MVTVQRREMRNGVVEEECSRMPFPQIFFGGMLFPQMISGQGGMVTQ